VMSACSSLVIIVKDGDSRIVQFSHFSVKEFLTANRLAEPIEMSRAITFDSRLRIRFLHKHALASSSDWTIALTVTTSRTSRWLDTLLSTGPRMPGLRMRRHASRMGWNVCLTQTSHTLQRGFGFTTKMGRSFHVYHVPRET
jgi:hypothetical protein